MALTDDKMLATLPDAAQLYVNKLKFELEKAKQKFDKDKAAYDARHSEFQKAVAWEALLRKCLNSLNQTDVLSAQLKNLIKNAADQVDKVGRVAECSVLAFRHMLNDLEAVSCCIEQFKISLLGLIRKIPKGTNSGISDKDPLVDSFNKLLTGLEEAYQCTIQLIKDMLKVLQNGELLWKGLLIMNNTDKHVKNPSLAGFINSILAEFEDNNGDPACDDTEFPDSACTKPKFPLRENGNDFLKEIEEEQNNAWKKLYEGANSLRSLLNLELQKKNESQTCYEAIKAAYEAALAAYASKN